MLQKVASATESSQQSGSSSVIPSILWVVLALIALIAFRKKVRSLLQNFSWRLRTGGGFEALLHRTRPELRLTLHRYRKERDCSGASNRRKRRAMEAARGILQTESKHSPRSSAGSIQRAWDVIRHSALRGAPQGRYAREPEQGWLNTTLVSIGETRYLPPSTARGVS